MSTENMGLISLFVGVVSFAASMVFFIVGTRAEQRNQAVLEKINAAIQNWQNQIMSSSIELLESRVEIVGKRVALEDAKTKQAFIAELAERIKYIVENPASESLGPAQAHQLDQLLKAFDSTTIDLLKKYDNRFASHALCLQDHCWRILAWCKSD